MGNAVRTTGAARPGGTRPRRGLGDTLSGVAVAIGCVLFLGGFVWGAIVYQPYTVPTRSMAPTIQAGDRVLAERVGGDEVRRGDVVVFYDSVWGDVPMVKRVVAVGGDTVACCDAEGRITVNGEPVDEEYLGPDDRKAMTRFGERVPEGRLFLLGDHRTTSQDSLMRLEGDADHWAVPRDAVRGRVDATAWPLEGFGMVERPEGFTQLPGGVSRPGPLVPMLIAVGAGTVLIMGGAAHGPLSRRSAAAPHGRRRS
ncbi:signal peptidase I [Streptomyces sp. RKND-216]|uniref:signal peptidase I n=1 Tax=Streptomyces sp. RKND-216 TaxID=2562581 RepID=UPI00109DA7A6|nr:signal peptidase I [Streptomyces sp. RKND-216]THA24274.1 signal peptidase I [Streptomyces sp. RKND-216]